MGKKKKTDEKVNLEKLMPSFGSKTPQNIREFVQIRGSGEAFVWCDYYPKERNMERYHYRADLFEGGVSFNPANYGHHGHDISYGFVFSIENSGRYGGEGSLTIEDLERVRQEIDIKQVGTEELMSDLKGFFDYELKIKIGEFDDMMGHGRKTVLYRSPPPLSKTTLALEPDHPCRLGWIIYDMKLGETSIPEFFDSKVYDCRPVLVETLKELVDYYSKYRIWNMVRNIGAINTRTIFSTSLFFA